MRSHTLDSYLVAGTMRATGWHTSVCLCRLHAPLLHIESVLSCRTLQKTDTTEDRSASKSSCDNSCERGGGLIGQSDALPLQALRCFDTTLRGRHM